MFADRFTQWIDHHGLFVALCLFIFAIVVGSAPKDLPSYWGFWRIWAFNSIQALGANAGNFAKNSPLLKNLKATELTEDGKGGFIETSTDVHAIAPAAVAPSPARLGASRYPLADPPPPGRV